jgi:Spy/CpxP family protein refolding chaperone
MKKYVSLTVLVAFLSLIFLPSVIHGQASEKPQKKAREESPRGARNFLGLTPEQKAKLEELRKLDREKQKAHFESMRKARLEMREMMKDSEANEKEILKLYDQMSTLRAEQFKNSLLKRKEYGKILTPEQLEKLEKFNKRMTRGRRPQRGQFMRGRGFSRRGNFFRQGRMNSFRRGAHRGGRPFMRPWRWR